MIGHYIIAISSGHGWIQTSLIDRNGFSLQLRTVSTNALTVNGELGEVTLVGANEAGIRRQPFNIHRSQNQPLFLSQSHLAVR